MKSFRAIHSFASRPAGQASRRTSAGYMLIEYGLVALLAAIAAAQGMQATVMARRVTAADIEAGKFTDIRLAYQKYVDDSYTELQSGLPITLNGVTLPVGTSSGQTYAPTPAQLVAMGYLAQGFDDSSMFSAGHFATKIERLPAGCVSTACTVEGKVWMDQPYLYDGTAEDDGLVTGELLSKLGSLGGVALVNNPSQIVGAGVAWTWSNPIPGNPVGAFVARYGASTSTVMNFVRINDTRDPNLQGNLSVAGNFALQGNAGIIGDTTLGGKLDVAGATSLSTLSVSGASTLTGAVTAGSTITAAGAIKSAGAVSGLSLAATTAGGVVRAQMDSATGKVTANNSAGSATITLDGSSGLASATSMQVLASKTAGAACSNNGEVVQDASASGTVLVCRSGTYRRVAMGLGEVTIGAACTPDGAMGQTSTALGAVCRGGVWRLLNDRLSASVPMALWNAKGAAVVPAPACGVGGAPDIIVTPLQSGADYGGSPPRNRFEAQVTGAGPWTVNPVLVDTAGTSSSSSYAGAAYNFGWTATTYCLYPA